MFTTQQINREFKIKVHGFINNRKVNLLYGVSGLKRILEETKTNNVEDQNEIFNNMIKRAFNSIDDKCICHLRRGIKIGFYRY